MYGYRVEQKKGGNFGEESFVRSDLLSIDCPKLVGSRKEGNSNRGHFTSLYIEETGEMLIE